MGVAFGGFVKTFFLLFPFPEEFWNTAEIKNMLIRTVLNLFQRCGVC